MPRKVSAQRFEPYARYRIVLAESDAEAEGLSAEARARRSLDVLGMLEMGGYDEGEGARRYRVGEFHSWRREHCPCSEAVIESPSWASSTPVSGCLLMLMVVVGWYHEYHERGVDAES